MSEEHVTVEDKNKKTGKVLVSVVVGMFIVGFASIPLYRIYCAAVDPGGSSASNGSVDAYGDTKIDTSREVTIRFATAVNRQLPWSFDSSEKFATVHPGEKTVISFTATNTSDTKIKGKAVYDINPPQAGQYFKKLECFCFREQTLDGKESMEMPLKFWFDPDMPADIGKVTVAYTFFNVDSSMTRSTREQASK